MFKLCLVIARFNTAARVKESEPYSFFAFKAFLKYYYL